MVNILFGLFVLHIAAIIIWWRRRQLRQRAAMEDVFALTKEELLNSKVKPEEGFVVVEFGGKTIQLSTPEALVWNSWDRERKRKFVRDFKKVAK